jgi:hypothetical protein
MRMTSLLEDSVSGACYKSHGMKIKCVDALYREVILAVTSVKSKSCVEIFNFENKSHSLQEERGQKNAWAPHFYNSKYHICKATITTETVLATSTVDYLCLFGCGTCALVDV